MIGIKPSPFSLVKFQVDEFFIKREPREEGKPSYKFEPKGFIDRKSNSFLLTIDFEVSDSNDAYKIKATCKSFFKFKVEEAEQLLIDSYFYLNGPAIVFPYIRSYIASVTALSGLSAVHLPLMNFPKVIETQLKENTTISEGTEPLN